MFVYLNMSVNVLTFNFSWFQHEQMKVNMELKLTLSSWFNRRNLDMSGETGKYRRTINNKSYNRRNMLYDLLYKYVVWFMICCMLYVVCKICLLHLLYRCSKQTLTDRQYLFLKTFFDLLTSFDVFLRFFLHMQNYDTFHLFLFQNSKDIWSITFLILCVQALIQSFISSSMNQECWTHSIQQSTSLVCHQMQIFRVVIRVVQWTTN